MNVNWLLESDVFGEEIVELRKEIERQGMCAKTADYIPFAFGQTYLDLFKPEECVVYYGSLNFGRQVAREAKWVPGVYCNLPNFQCTTYYTKLGKFLLNKNYVMLPFGELKRCKEWLLQTVGNNGCVFLRPSSGFKLFTGTVVEAERWDSDIPKLGFYDVEPNEIVVAAEPQNIAAEWRLVVAKRNVIAASQYRSQGEVSLHTGAPDDVVGFAQEIADEGFEPDPVWCLDVCRTPDGTLHLLEINSFSSSGFYACDKRAIVSEVSKVALEEWQELLG